MQRSVTKVIFVANYLIFIYCRLMSVIYLLIGISFIVALAFLVIFLMAVRKGQFEDDYTPSVRMLFDDTIDIEEANINQSQNQQNEQD